MKNLAVFDFDGTLLDSISSFENTIRAYSTENGLAIPCFESLKRGYHDPLNHDFKWNLSRVDQLRHLRAAWARSDAGAVAGDPAHIPDLFSGAHDALETLRKNGFTLAIVTARLEASLLPILRHHNIINMFSRIRALNDVERRGEPLKPAPDMLLGIMRELRFTPEKTVMVGDTAMDIKMARNAGTHAIGVTWGAHPRNDLEQAGAHHIVDTHFPAVTDAIRKIFS